MLTATFMVASVKAVGELGGFGAKLSDILWRDGMELELAADHGGRGNFVTPFLTLCGRIGGGMDGGWWLGWKWDSSSSPVLLDTNERADS